MRFGVFTSLTGTTWDAVLTLWRHVESAGWDAACVTDHFMPNTPERVGDALEAWTTLTALATLVPRMRVGTIVLGNTYRHPAVVAKMATTLDIVTGGRLICGLGAAWQESEHQAYGIPFYTLAERLARLEEACQVLKLLWTQPKSMFHGTYYRLDDAPSSPKPVQRPHPELMIGGGGEKVTLRIVARHADHWNVWGGPATLARKGKIVDEHCRALGRDPRTLTRSANIALGLGDDPAARDRLAALLQNRFGMPEDTARDTAICGSPSAVVDKIHALHSAGVDMIFIPTMVLAKDPRPILDRFITEVAPHFR